ncbi:unnamed protein product [Gongylonema pulchrum]|uniref:protein phosphatase methylesterase-1 n=1 Tax=Gongylonema pulchrum TaxID=637853 RepID=A0A183E2U6_9BILA|nr:unnamed protein product [Gongylonema pulchrum]
MGLVTCHEKQIVTLTRKLMAEFQEAMRRVMRARKVLPSISEHGSASFAAAAAVGPAPMAPGGSPRVVPETSLAPLEWDVFFDKKLDVSISEQDIFCVYTKGDAGPMFFLLHGGGYSGLTWACLTEELSTLAQCRIVAPDLRGHGNTVTADELDLSTERQIEDIVAIHKKICGDESVPTIVVGHSMGGALAVHAVASGRIKDAVALTVIDVVEGTAMEALNTMKHFLRNRPQKFGTVGAAIEWCSKSGTAKNVRAAQVSMPAQIRKIGDVSIFVCILDLLSFSYVFAYLQMQ